MLRQKLRLPRRCLRVVPFDCLGDPGMKLLSPALQRAIMRGALHQRVLECVDRLGRIAAAKRQSGGLELRQRLAKV